MIYVVSSAFIMSFGSADLYAVIFYIKRGLRTLCITVIHFASLQFILCVVLCMCKHEFMHGYLEDYDFKCMTVST